MDSVTVEVKGRRFILVAEDSQRTRVMAADVLTPTLNIEIPDCPVVAYFFEVPLVQIRRANGSLNPCILTAKIRGLDTFDGNAVRARHPYELNLNEFFYLLLIRHADEDNEVFSNMPEIPLLRKNWRLLFVNMTGSDLRLRESTVPEDTLQSRRMSLTRGLVHCRRVILDSLVDPGS